MRRGMSIANAVPGMDQRSAVKRAKKHSKPPAYGQTIRIGYNGGLCLGAFGIAQMAGLL